jgi:hypothetical protein
MQRKMRRDSEPVRQARAEERKQLVEAVASLDGAVPQRLDLLPLQDPEPDGADPFAPAHNPD